jgi:hypothetical protein
MKYVCLGYYDKGKFDGMTEGEQHAMFDTCFEYDDHLRANGHFSGGEALQPAETALTLYWRTAKSQLRTVPMRKPRNNSAAFLSLRRGT